MKMTQDPSEYKPITIVLETQDEATFFEGIVNNLYKEYPLDSPEREMLMAMANSFTTCNF